MNSWGWIFFITSWTVIISLLAFSFYRTLKASKQQK